MLRVSVLRLPRISNFTDVDALAAEPGVLVRFAATPGRAGRRRPGGPARDPGDRGRPGLAAGARAGRGRSRTGRRAGRPVLGICGGYQMLGTRDRRPGGVPGRAGGRAGAAAGAGGVRPGQGAGAGAWHRVRRAGDRLRDPPWGAAGHRAGPFPGGCRSAPCSARRGTARWRATASGGRSWLRSPRWPGGTSRPQPGTSFAAARQARLDTLADLVAGHLDQATVDRLISHGAPAGLPVIGPAWGPAGVRLNREPGVAACAGPGGPARLPGPARCRWRCSAS